MFDFANSLLVSLFFDSFMLPVAGGKGLSVEGACGLKTLTSKKARSWCPPQKPLAATSSLAPSAVRAEALDSISPVTGCRAGSMHTSWQTSIMSLAV